MKILGVHKGAVETLIGASILGFIVRLVAGRWTFENFALRAATVFTKPWTLISSMFLHVGFSHLIFNMIALFFFGLYLERVVGEENFLRVYFMGGAFASIAYVFTSLLFNVPAPHVYAVGASGAVFAVMGALTVLRPNMTVLVYFLIPMPLYVLMILYVIMSVPALLYPIDNVAHNAHLGGLVAGYLFGRYFKDKIQSQTDQTRMYGYRFR